MLERAATLQQLVFDAYAAWGFVAEFALWMDALQVPLDDPMRLRVQSKLVASATVAEIAKRTGLTIAQVKQVVHTLSIKGTLECLHPAPSYSLKLGATRPIDRRGRKVV